MSQTVRVFDETPFVQPLEGATKGDDRFLNTTRESRRLNARFGALIVWSLPWITGKRVLDLASHDGRWSWAALVAGASHVTGVEARGDLVEYSGRNMAALGIDPSRYTFIKADLHEQLALFEKGQFDTVFCFGFLYHTTQQFDVLRRIRLLEPRYVIVDTMVTRLRNRLEEALRRRPLREEIAFAERLEDYFPLGMFWTEDASSHLAAFATAGQSHRAISGSVNVKAYEMFCRVLGFSEPEAYDWAAPEAGFGYVPEDYRTQDRVTFRFTVPTDDIETPGAEPGDAESGSMASAGSETS